MLSYYCLHSLLLLMFIVQIYHSSGVNEAQQNLPHPEKISDEQKERNEPVDGAQKSQVRSKRSAAHSNCAEVQKAGHRTNGIYTIQVMSKEIEVYCDLTTNGGGWTIFQRRDDFPPPTDFYRNWMSYKMGFGDLNKEFWLGLDNIHHLAASEPFSLRIELEDFEGARRHADYTRFHVAEEENNYKLLVEGFSGDVGDYLTHHSGQPFSTWDRDNDSHKDNCAKMFFGGWWYKYCHLSNLNGKYLRGNHSTKGTGVNWNEWRGHNYSLKKTEMKARPVDFPSYKDH